MLLRAAAGCNILSVVGDETAKDDVLPLVALRNMVMFPGVVVSLRIGRPRSVAAVAEDLRTVLPKTLPAPCTPGA